MTEHRTRKRFGQHFLHDRNLVDRLVRTLGLQPGDTLVEIGPGRGALTYPLLEEMPHLHVVELDRDLIALLRQENSPERLTIHESDALRFDFTTLKPADGKLRVVGNLPYNISTPLIFHLLAQSTAISDMTFMLQKEVVDRLTASPGTRDWGRLSIMVQYHCQADYLFFVPPGAFSPPPKVDSAVVRLIPHVSPPYPAKDEAHLRRLVTQAFTQRRKAIRNGLKSLISAEQFEALGIDPGLRPDQLGVAEYVALANASTPAAENPETPDHD
ncbi:ribosomal RNA adenine dimethylase [Alcanivorax hongdengensis A-11-3]|uniref:Ribosomal RNA small subunit methyltransferase A n=1 Tax=Alcanivorax hongdengensis A-11-3 TaxID=1177179 RepID=L0WCB2_9GAMM|nr:16S rRNA (adenine(1518)-N(6)/adenine(1519)-N(6))-dimethyltransferase RsmA [Alcanivorax hongdengensis]EKF74639.1 ribosomal RNA adenine dimethylase [Alcanivorax hongdengensis A-11-3]